MPRSTLDFGRDGVSELRRIGYEHRGGQLVVLGLADEVGGDEVGVGRGIRDHEDLGRSRLGVDADDASDEALGCCDVVVARAGDDIDGVEPDARHAVGECADRAGTTHRVDLVDAEQAGGPEDRGVHGTPELLLRGRSERDRRNAGDLRGHDVHDDARRIDGLAAGNVKAHARDRLPPLDDLGARRNLGNGASGNLRLGGSTDPIDRFFECGSHVGEQRDDGLRDLVGVNSNPVGAHAIESFRLLEQRSFATLSNVVDERASGLRRGRNVDGGARDEAREFHSAGLLIAKVNRVHHGLTMLVRDGRGNIASSGMIDTHV